MTSANRHALFDVFGVELEYMLVDQETLDIRPQADAVLRDLAGETTTDFESGANCWSNELALHVLELKTTRPTAPLSRLPAQFSEALSQIRPVLAERNLLLLPTAMHPWMNPQQETQLWPHEYSEIYQTYDRIFDCRRHGWANIQSVHLNLPFADGHEFSRLMAAIRIVLPLLPALAASSPIIDGRPTGWLDTRLDVYRDHCRQLPSLTGQLIPEAIYDEYGYRQRVLDPIMKDIRPHDPHGILQHDFLNARGAIARFDRGSIEIRLIDVQEFPRADIAICAAVTAVLRALVNGRWSDFSEQCSLSTSVLSEALLRVGQEGATAEITNSRWLALLGIQSPAARVGEIWDHLIDTLSESDPELSEFLEPLDTIRTQGCLATRIAKSLGASFSHQGLLQTYRRLAECLQAGTPFLP